MPRRERDGHKTQWRWFAPMTTTTIIQWITLAGILIVFIQSDMLRRLDGDMSSRYDASPLSDFHRTLHSRRAYHKGHLQTPMTGQANDALPKAVLPLTEAMKAKEARKAQVRLKVEKRKHEKEARDHKRYIEGKNLTKTFDYAMKDFSDYPIMPTRRFLPDMNTGNGGVIFFLHVPKTGGQTIRHNFGGLSTFFMEMDQMVLGDLLVQVRFVLANTLEAFYETALPKINRYLTAPYHKRKKILFVEVHGMDNHNAIELEPFIHAWRGRSNETKIPFFAFTLIREAVSEQISFFNFFFIHPGDSRFCNNSITISTRCMPSSSSDSNNTWIQILNTKRETFQILSTVEMNRGIDLEDAMVKSIYNNPQCLFLARGERTYGANASHLREDLNETECDTAYKSLQRTMDWIGRTENIRNETLPLLTKMMFNDSHVASFIKDANRSPKRYGFISLSQIKPSTLEFLKQSSQLDDQLYRHVVEDYRMNQWVNFQLQ
jgi:hypothetical protein